MGAKVIKIGLTEDFSYNFQAILENITPKTKLVYFCSPNNPTGTYITKTDMDLFFEKLPEHVIVVFDGAYSQYATNSDYTNGVEYVQNGKQMIVIQTFSKIYGLAGIRVGFAIASEPIINSIHKVREPFNVNLLAQVAAEAAIKDVNHVVNSQLVNAQGRTQLYKAFNELGLTYTTSMANFILVNIGYEAYPVYEKLLHKGIIVRYGGVWGLNNQLRITIGTEQENSRFIAALKEVLEDR